MVEKRPIHINLSKGAHVELKKMCAEERVTMQEVIEYFVNGIVDKKEEMLSIFAELSKLKKTRKINRVAKVEMDEIYSKILGGMED